MEVYLHGDSREWRVIGDYFEIVGKVSNMCLDEVYVVAANNCLQNHNKTNILIHSDKNFKKWLKENPLNTNSELFTSLNGPHVRFVWD